MNKRLEKLKSLFSAAEEELYKDDIIKISMGDLKILFETIDDKDQKIHKLTQLLSDANKKLVTYFATDIPSIYDFEC
jgi:hypothetical protein